jgi:tetratricopeptide (TPR) repeat protein
MFSMKKILILAANPRKDLNLDREIRDLKRVIESSDHGADFQVEDELAVRVSDLQDLLFKHRPQIVHFCGHGGGEQGLVFESDLGREQQIQTEALSDLFRLFASGVECVLLNACYSETQADSIVDHIDFVIGMNQAIRDDAAISFSKGFYRALGYACSIEEAFEFGRNAIQLEISGSSVIRSNQRSTVISESERKLNVVNAVTTVAIPEHLKPILKKNRRVSAAVRANPISLEKQTEIQLEIEQSLTEARAKLHQPQSQKSIKQRWLVIGGVTIGLLSLGIISRQWILPGISRSYTQKGLEQFRSGDRKNAESNYQWAIRLDANNPKAHLYLGILYEEAQQLDQAHQQYEIAARQDEFMAINNLARLYILKNQNREADGLLMNALKLEHKLDLVTKYAILKNLGWVKLQEGDYGSAGNYLEKAIALKHSANLDANIAAPHCLLAQVYEGLKDLQEAQTEWENCLALADSSNPDENKWLIIAQQKVDRQEAPNDKTKKNK